jgi:hypothetical protein
MATKKPEAVFEVVFSGPGVYPEQIPLGSLSRILSAIHSLAMGHELPTDDDGEAVADDDKDPVRLVDVKRGSAILRFADRAAKQSIKNLREVGRILKDPEKIGDNIHILNPIEDLSASARRLNCSIIMKQAHSNNGVLARIEPTSYHSLSQSVFVSGETAVMGSVQRVGGATARKCGLRVSFQPRMLFCRVASTELARTLGQLLYQQVVVHGTARWVKASWRLYSLEISAVKELKEGTAEQAIESLRQAGGKGWDDIDNPQEFLEETTAS